MSKKNSDLFPDGEISNEWGKYAVKAVLSEEKGLEWPELSSDEIKAYQEGLAANFESHIYLLPTPILVNTNEVVDVFIVRRGGKIVRIYPPFQVNEKSQTSGAFDEVLIPEGTRSVERTVQLPSSAVRGVRMEHGTSDINKWCRAFRLDVENGADEIAILNLLLDHISQYTHQWWIRESHNPMLGPIRMGGTITKNFCIAAELRHRGAGNIQSSWYGSCQFQPNLGFGSPLKKRGWLISAHHTQEGRKADQGLLAFYDGMADYMASRNDKAILNLCIATEIMLSKHSFAILKRTPSKLEKAVRMTKLVEKPIREKLKNLLIDRNQVAHGREPNLIGPGKENSIEIYIQAVRHLVTAYLNAMPLGDWSGIMDLRLDNSKIFKKRKKTRIHQVFTGIFLCLMLLMLLEYGCTAPSGQGLKSGGVRPKTLHKEWKRGLRSKRS